MIGESTASVRTRQWWRYLNFLVVMTVLAPVVLFAAHAVHSYNRTFAEVDDRLRRRAAMLSEHVARILDAQATVIDLVTGKLDSRPGVDLTKSQEIADLLALRVGRDRMVSTMMVTDTQGTVLASTGPISGLGVGDRDYFRNAQATGVFVGEPVIGRSSNRPVIVLSRRWHGGVICISLIVRELSRILAAASAGDEENGVVSLFRADGTLLVRHPAAGKPLRLSPGSSGLMQHIPQNREGHYRAVPVLDGQERHYAFHQIGNYPVWVSTGVNVREIEAHWLRDLIPHALLTLLAITVLTGSSVIGGRRERAAAVDAHSARKEALATAERANRAKAHFLASASHDLRQPIQGVRLFLDVLDGRLEDHFDRHVLRNAVMALEGAEGLLSALLDVSTLEAGMIKASAQAVPLHDVLPGLAEEFSGQADRRNLTFRFVPCAAWVRTDPVLLARMLRNLLTNAVRYTHTGRILLGCRRHGRTIRVEVWDTGIGIPDDKLDAVFDDFVQIGNPERDRAKGLGLGLAVVRRMAVLLGHQVGLRSRLGRGTVFWIALPVVEKPNLPV